MINTMTEFRFKCRKKNGLPDEYEIVTIPCDPASLTVDERECIQQQIAWPIRTMPMDCPIEERCLSSDEIIEEGRRLEHPEWWPDEVLDVCKARVQEGIITPEGDWNENGIWESCLIETESPTIESLLTALYDGLDEDFDEDFDES